MKKSTEKSALNIRPSVPKSANVKTSRLNKGGDMKYKGKGKR